MKIKEGAGLVRFLGLRCKKSILIACAVVLVCFGIFAVKILASDPPSFSNVALDPALDISRFGQYQVTADITNLPVDQAATVNLSGINGDGGNYWNYRADGTPVSDTVTKTMSYDSGTSKWRSTAVYPDSIYPEILFAPSSVTWNNAPQNMVVRRNNYQLLHYANNFTSQQNMTFWIEVNAYRRSAVNSADLEVYLVEKGHDLDFFQSDWRNAPEVELAGTINRTANFNHTHTANSSHHLVALSANSDGTFGTKNLDISGDFWVLLYSQSPNDSRGFDLRYQPSSLCNNNSRWYSGSQAGWTTTAQSGCPDAHVHMARRSSPGGVRDGVKLVTTATYDGETGSKTTNLYYNDLPNLAPNTTSFTSPSVGGTYAGDIAVAWDPASDPNNDTLNYDLFLMDENNVQVGDALLTDSALTTYNLQSAIEGHEIPNGSYRLKGTVCDQGVPTNDPPDTPLCTDFSLPGTFTINNSAAIRTLSSVSIASNNANSSFAKAGDTVTLSFTASGAILTPTVGLYANGNVPINNVILTSADNIHWTASYLVSPEGQSGEVSFEILAANLNQEYFDTTDNTVVTVDNINPSVENYSPADNSDKNATDANLILTLNEDISVMSGKNLVIKKSSDNSTVETILLTGPQVVLSGGGSIVTVNPSADFSDKTSYYILIDSGSFSDVAGNLYAGLTSAAIWNFTVGDVTAPTLINVNISSNNSNNSLATTGDTIILLIEADEPIATPAVTFSVGGNNLSNAPIITNTTGNIWTAVFTIGGTDQEGLVSFAVNFQDVSNNIPPEVILTSDNSTVTIYFDQAPTVTVASTNTASATPAQSILPSVTPVAVPSVLASATIVPTAIISAAPITAISATNIATFALPKAPVEYGPVEDLYDLTIKATQDNKPLAGIKVEIYSNVREGVTDVHGKINFPNVEAGVHKIKIYSNGNIFEKEITVSGTQKKVFVDLEVGDKSCEWIWYLVSAILIVATVVTTWIIKPRRNLSPVRKDRKNR